MQDKFIVNGKIYSLKAEQRKQHLKYLADREIALIQNYVRL